MKFSRVYLVLLSIVFVFSNCSTNKNLVKVSFTNFTNEIEQDQNLSFTFDKKLVPDSIFNVWDTTQYLTFNPAIKGKFKWVSASELVFSPSEIFYPSTDYKAQLTNNLSRYSTTKYKVDEKSTIDFHTPYLTNVGSQLFYAMSQKNPGAVEVRINLTFNCKVDPNSLQKLLHISINENSIPFEMVSTVADNILGIAIADQEQNSDSKTPINISIDKGLGCIGSTYRTKEKFETTADLPEKEKLIVASMTSSFIDGAGVVNIMMNQPVQSENLSDFIKVEPTILYKVEATESGIQISGDFEASKSYNLTISKDLKGLFGYGMEVDYSDMVSFGELDPMIQFASSKSMYLSNIGEKNIAISIASIQKIKLTVSKVYENNIIQFMNSGKEWGYSYEESEDDDYSYHDYQYYNVEEYGDEVLNKTIEISSLPKSNNVRLLHFNTDELDYSSSFKGIYVVKVQDTEHQWLQASTIISLSDIGIIAKQSKNAMLVFVNSILKASPIANVKVDFISTNNQKIYSATTDNNGVAIFNDMKTKSGKFKVGMITCRDNQDFNFMLLNKTRVETSRFDVGGKYSNDAQLDAFIYGDRDIYRPGDSIHINTIVRTEDWKTLKDVPVKLKLILPNGKEYQTKKINMNDQGAAAADFYIPNTVITGMYKVELFTANDILLSSKNISVEEFMPDRIKVNTTLDKEKYLPSENVQATIKAENYFGPPAANRNYEVELSLKRKNFTNKKFNQYNFNIETSSFLPLSNILRQGKTDENGNINESFPLPSYSDYGIFDGKIYTTVFDETGRPVNRVSQFDVLTQNVFYGIRHTEYWVNTKSNLAFQFIALNDKGVVANSEAQVEIYRYRWETVIEHTGSRYRYKSEKKAQLLSTKKVSLGANGAIINFTPINSGDYEVRIKKPGAETYVSNTFYAYGFADTDNSSFEVSSEGEVIMESDKEVYNVGDDAKILLKTPFNGKVLVTIERGDVIEYYYKETKDKAVNISIPISEKYLPNVFISATAIRNISGPSLPLTVARGFIPIKVEQSSNKIPVSIIAKESTRSKTIQTITVKSIPGAQVTIAAVDEGILALKDFKTPDPYKYFYAMRALEVSSYDLYPYLFPEIQSRFSSVGGDGYDLSKRVNPLASKRINLVAKWSGIIKTNSNGEATYTFTVPQFSGAVRIMAVAYKDKAFGNAEKMMKVADPVVISSALPRFFSPGDTLSMPVTLSNTTAAKNNLTANITLSGPLMVVGNNSQSVQVNSNSESQIIFKIAAKESVGIGTVTVNVNNGSEKFSDQTEISIRPTSSLTKISDDGIIKSGELKSINLSSDFIPSSAGAKLIISTSPLIQFSKNLNYLIQYPYGCIEQTVSAAFPQLYFNDLAQALYQNNKSKGSNPDYNIREAIKKIESMQLYNGAFSYWQGGDYESWWGTVYACHFLIEADKAGFDINKNTLDKALSYIQFKSKDRKTVDYYYWDESNISRTRKILSRETAYSVYVLALAGKYDMSTLNFCKANQQLLTLDSRYMIACAFAISGNQISYKAMLPAVFTNERTKEELAGSFASPIRDEALALNCLFEANPNDPQIGTMARHLSTLLKKERWLNTQEASFSLLALGKVARKAAGSNVNATIKLNGKTIADYKAGKTLIIDKNIYGNKIEIVTNGNGNLYYAYEMEGISAIKNTIEEDKNLSVRRYYFNRYGKAMSNNSFNQNDLIVIKIMLQSSSNNENIENVAVTDLLPAGFEIENPRISAIPELTWIKDAAEPDYIDIRDDRINIFTTSYSAPRYYYYVVRAVNKGLFKQGPVSADAMYDIDYHSYNGAGTIEIK